MSASTHLPTNWFRDTVIGLSFVVVGLVTEQAFSQATTVTVEGREYREVVDLQGASVHGFQVTQISAKLGGFVKSIGKVDDLDVDVGSRVRKGDVLAKLDIPEMQNDLAEKIALVEQTKSAVSQADAVIAEAEAAVAQANAALRQVKAGIAEKEAKLKLSKTRLKRLSGLAASGTIGQDNIDEAQFEVEAATASLQSVEADVTAAEANIEAAEASVVRAKADKATALSKVKVAESNVARLKVMVDYTVIRAPYDGVITKRMVDLGSFVQPSENNSAAMPLFELTQVSKVRIMVAVPNNKVSKIEVGQAIEFHSIGGLEGSRFVGKVTRTAGALDLKTRTMQIEVHLDNPATDSVSEKKLDLKPGLFGTLTVIRKDWTGDDLLPVVPTTAVGKDDNGNYFVSISDGGETSRRIVQIAFNDAAMVGISSGLKVGEKVLKQGLRP